MQKIKQSFLTIVIGLALAAGLSYAAPWVGPTANPPGNNVEAPLNVGPSTQYKGGALGVGGLLRAYGPAIFDGKIKIGDDAVSPVAGSIRWTGTDFEGYDGTLWKSFTSGEIITPLSYKIAEMREKQFTANGVFEVPSGVTTVWVSLIGGGGGGGGGASYYPKKTVSGNIPIIGTPGGGGGRSQAEIYLKQFSVSPGAEIPVTVGAGGAGGASVMYVGGAKGTLSFVSQGEDGKDGGNSSFGDFVSVAGGKGGKIGVAGTKYHTIPGLGGALDGKQGQCSDIYSGKRIYTCSNDTYEVYADQYGGAGGSGEWGAYTLNGGACAQGGENTTVCSYGPVNSAPARDGQNFGSGGGGGIVNPILFYDVKIKKYIYTPFNGGNGKGGYVYVSWCDAGYSRVGDTFTCQEG